MVYRAVRGRVPPLKEDRQLDEEIRSVADMITDGSFTRLLEKLREQQD